MNTITIKDSKGNVVCSVESTPVDFSTESLFETIKEAQRTIESCGLDCAKYANTLDVMSTESFGQNIKEVAAKFLQKVKEFFQKVVLWCKNTFGKIIINQIRNEKLKGILNAINNWLYAVAKEYTSIDQKELKTYVEGYEQRINRLIGLISKIMTCLQRVAFLCIQLEKSASISEVLVLVGKAVKCLMIKDELDYIENNIIAIDDENKLEQTYKSIESKIDDMTAFIDQKIQERQYKTEVK